MKLKFTLVKDQKENREISPEYILFFLVGFAICLLFMKYNTITLNATIELSDIVTLTVGGILSVYIAKTIQSSLNERHYNDSLFSDEVKAVIEKFKVVETLLVDNKFDIKELNKALKQANMAAHDLIFICDSVSIYNNVSLDDYKSNFIELRRNSTGKLQIHIDTTPGNTLYFLAKNEFDESIKCLNSIKQRLIQIRFNRKG